LNQPSKGFTVGVSIEHEAFRDALSGTSVISSATEERTFFRTMSLGIGYHFSPRLSVNIMAPYKHIVSPKTDLRTGIRFTRNYSGLADIILHNRLQLNTPGSERSPIIWLGLGLKLPTGDSQPDWDWGFGNSHDPVLQPGTGSLDQLFSADYFQVLGKIQLYSRLLYRLSGGENIHGYKFGNEFQYTLATAYQVSNNVQISTQINGLYTAEDYDKSLKVSNTGGRWIYLTPSIKIGSTDFAYQLNAHVPVYRYVNNAQLIADYVFSLRMIYAFNPPYFHVPTNAHRLNQSREYIRNDTFIPDIKTISLGQEITLETVRGKVTLFEFYSDTCLSCEKLEPLLHELARTDPSLAIRKINIGNDNSPIISQYNITTTPEVRVFDPLGRFVGTIAGADIDLIRLTVTKAINK